MAEPNPAGLRREDYPALFCVADDFSMAAQEKYMRFLSLGLAALIAAALCSAVQVSDAGLQRGLFAVGAALMAVSLYATLMVAQKSYRERWYGARAVAESVKTYAWRYMMRAEPFAHSEDAAAMDRRFLSGLRDIMSQEALTLSGQPTLAEGSQITTRMGQIRALPVDDRKQIYVRDRVRDQRAWYSSKAAHNARREERLFLLVGIMQMAALITAIWLSAAPAAVPNVVGVFAALSASLLAWLQARRHEELAQSYLVAAQELGLIEAQAAHVREEASFSGFVADAETAISREHTLWLARRDTSERGILL